MSGVYLLASKQFIIPTERPMGQITPLRPVIRIAGLFLILSLAFSNCVERFEPEDRAFESLLIVEGLITDRPEPYVVRLTRSTPIDSPFVLPEAGAVVSVADGRGNEWLFAETRPGVYESDPAEFVGEAGEVYKLRIVSAALGSYESEEVVLKESPSIDSIYYERQERVTETDAMLDGIRIMAASHTNGEGTRYYKYDWEATYQIKVPYAPDTEKQICYNTDNSRASLVASTVALEVDQLSGFELTYVSTESYRLRSVYSILVRQYSLDEKGFRYWEELRKNSESLGTLFDPQPYPVTGNIINLNKPDEPVLGFFDASTVSEKRIYITYDELRDRELTFEPNSCVHYLVLTTEPPPGYCFAYYGPYGSGLNGYAPCECTDCAYFGTQGEPDFWGK